MLVVLSMLAGRLTEPISPLPDWTVFFFDVSAAGWFVVIFWITDQFLWKWGILHCPWLFQVPNLAGCWKGELKSSYDNMADPMECELEIKQTWTRLNVHFRTQRQGVRSSKSTSKAASLLLDQDGETVLRYEYHNEPDLTRKEDLDIHWGTTKVVVCEEFGNTVLEGSYYTNRKPQTYGTFTLRPRL